MHGKRREMGLGSDLDVSLARAREKAATARELLADGVDPQQERINDRNKRPAEPRQTFGAFTAEYLDTAEDSFSNAKHRQQWRNTLNTYAADMSHVAIAEVTTEHVLASLQPIWLTKGETASRVRQRIERVVQRCQEDRRTQS